MSTEVAYDDWHIVQAGLLPCLMLFVLLSAITVDAHFCFGVVFSPSLQNCLPSS